MRDFKVIINEELNEDQLQEIEEFLEVQETTDCERESTVIDYQGNEGDYTIRVICEDERPVKIIVGPLFSDLLKEAREKLNLTQAQAADKLEISFRAYQNYEYGERVPDGKIMLKLIRMFGLNPIQVEKSLEY